MTSHGFYAARFGSEFAPKEIGDFAEQVSRLPGIIRVHIVKVVRGGPEYNVIVEFTHLHERKEPPTRPDELLEEIQKIEINGKRTHEPAIWIIQRSYC